MPRRRLHSYLRGPNRKRALVADDFTSLKMVINANDVSAFTMSLPPSSKAHDLVGARFGVIVSVWDEVFSGDLDVIEQSTDAKGRSTFALQGSDDTAWLDRRVVLPGPPPDDPGTFFVGNIYPDSAYDEQTGPAETVMRHFVQFNAITHNPVDGLSLETNQLRGGTVDKAGRFQTLLEMVQSCATAGGLGFRVAQSGTGLKFMVHEPRDLSSTVVFAKQYGNLKSHKYVEKRPTCNHVIVAGQGEGTDRFFYEAFDPDSIEKWGRVMRFLDKRNESDTGKLQQAGDEALLKGAESRSLSITPINTGKTQYGRDYRVGDLVSVKDDRFGTIVDRVSQVTLSIKAGDVLSVTPIIGNDAWANPNVPELFKRLRTDDERFRNLERV
jgi:hypothetical protein